MSGLSMQQTSALNKSGRWPHVIKTLSGPVAILADYLGLIKKPSAERNDLAIGEITRGLKTMAMELNTPVICLSQLSREVETPNKRPLNADLRDSGSIEQDATASGSFIAMVPITRQPAARLAEIIIGKNRHGPQGGVGYQKSATAFPWNRSGNSGAACPRKTRRLAGTKHHATVMKQRGDYFDRNL